MSKLKRKLIFSVTVALGLTALLGSCNKDDSAITQQNQSIEEYNKNIIDALKVELDQQACLKSTGYDLKDLLNTDEGKALFSNYCINLKIEIEGNEYIINDYDPLIVDELYESTLDKLSRFDGTNLKSASSINVTDEEIRDAMLRECGTYAAPLGGVCKSAVWIAYWLR
jgi:hypothetical protein